MDDFLNKYHIHDAREISRLLSKEGFVDVTITSPPYWNLKNYECENQIGHGQKYKAYLDDLESVFESIYNMTKDSGSLWIISDTFKRKGRVVLLPFDISARLEKVGWRLQDIIIWTKDKSLPWSHQGKLRNIFEYIMFFSKERKFKYRLSRVRTIDGIRDWWVRYPERYNPKGKAPARNWEFPIPTQGSWSKNGIRHFNPLPPKLVERILLLTTDGGDVVLDPFSGTGTVLAQANVMERKYIGLDLNPEYQKRFYDRVLPFICKSSKDATDQDKKARDFKLFNRSIPKLRMTKYPKETLRLYTEKHGEVDLEAIITLKGKRLKVIFLFPKGTQVPTDFISRVEERSRKPPLSKYGITPEFAAYSADVASEAWLRSQGLGTRKYVYVYTEGRTYTWWKRITIKEWVTLVGNEVFTWASKRRYPPIVSDIDVDVDPKNPFRHPEEEK